MFHLAQKVHFPRTFPLRRTNITTQLLQKQITCWDQLHLIPPKGINPTLAAEWIKNPYV